MEKLVKITRENYPQYYKENQNQYLFVNENEQIVGTATIDGTVEKNKIKIDVLTKYQGNGYGKKIFEKALEEYKNQYSDTELRFEIENQSKAKGILHKFGSINIANQNGKMVYILPLK